jgi:hypothetical protein
MSDTVQTDYDRAAAGFDGQFRDALMAEIIGTVAERSVLTDAPLLAIRTGGDCRRLGAMPGTGWFWGKSGHSQFEIRPLT